MCFFRSKERKRKKTSSTHLVHPDLAVRDQAHHQHVPQRLGLPQRVGVAVVHHVEAAVHVHADRCARAPAAGVSREGAGEEGGDGPGAVVVLLGCFFLGGCGRFFVSFLGASGEEGG